MTVVMVGRLRVRSSALLILTLSISSPALLCAQNTTTQVQETPHEPSQLRPHLAGTGAEQGIVKLGVLVTDKAGNPVSGLKQRDFTVLDNGQPSEILTFHGFDGSSAKANPPVEIFLFLDSLGIPKKMEKFNREEVERFLRQDGGRLRHPTSVYEISASGLRQLKDPSGDGNALADQLERKKFTPWGSGFHVSRSPSNGGPARPDYAGSSLESGAYLIQNPANAAFQAVSAIATVARRRPGRKLMLWIGAGCCMSMTSGDRMPGPDATDAKKKVFDTAYWASTLFREAHMTIYSFSEGELSESGDRAYKALLDGPKSTEDVRWMSLYKKVLAIQSGGRVMYPDFSRMGQVDELRNQINDVVREADTFYMLSIDPSQTAHFDEYHALHVEVNQPTLTVRARTGYYDQPYYTDAPDRAIKHMTMAQVEAILKEDRGDRDAELAKRLSYIELTERMTSAKLRNWMMVFRGKKTRAALTALSDASAFLDPPREEVLNDAPPDQVAQKKMLALIGDYLNKTMPKLPNFFATRTTVRYEDAPAIHERGTERNFEPLHAAESIKETVLYRNGKEVVVGKNKTVVPGMTWMATHGTFGPMLSWVSDALDSPGELIWSRWERRADGRVAVFHWSVPERRSTYSMVGCCLPDKSGNEAFAIRAAFRAEVTIDPETGAILRLQIQSDLLKNAPPSTTPESLFDIMIEYGATEIGGIPYVCPIRSVTVSHTRSVTDVRQWDQSFKTYGPYWTLLSDATFDDYHRFRSDARIITDVPPEDEQ
jgi:VWFA-related protein